MSQPLVPPPMSLRLWVVLFVLATATIYLGLLREANSAPPESVAVRTAPVDAGAIVVPVRTAAFRE